MATPVRIRRLHEAPTRTQLATVESVHPGWHAWVSDGGRCWATSPHSHDPAGSGATLDADTAAELDAQIGLFESAHEAA